MRRGYAAEAAAAALGFAFERHGFGEVAATVMAENAASHRVMEKLGFEAAGSHEQWGRAAVLYRLTRARWQRASCAGER